ncbi:MAG: hypothetical protein ABIQ59_15250 [Nocardioidaceae bacterium]
MPAKTTKTSPTASAPRSAATKERAADLRAEDRALAERVHVAVTSTAPDLAPKTWHGMPAYADAEGKLAWSPRSRRWSPVW